MAFDPDKYLAKTSSKSSKGFDPDLYLAKKTQDVAPSEPRRTEAFVEGLGQTASFGALPYLQAGTERAIEALTPESDVDKKLREQGFTVSQPDRDLVAEYKKRGTGLEAQHPGYSGGGKVLGLLAGAGPVSKGVGLVGTGISKVVPGMEAGIKALQASKIGKPVLNIAKAGTSGAAQTAIQTPGSAEERLEAAKTGGLISAAIPAAGTALKVAKEVPYLGAPIKAASEFGSNLAKFGAERTAAGLGLFKHQAKQMIKSDPTGMEGHSIEQLGKWADKNKIVRPGDDIAAITEKTAAIKKATGEEIGKFYDEAENATAYTDFMKTFEPSKRAEITKRLKETSLDKKTVLKDINKQIEEEFTGKAGGQAAINKVKNEIKNLSAKPQLSLSDLQEYKSGLDDIIFKSNKFGTAVPEHMAGLKKLRDIVKQKMDDRIEALADIYGSKSGKGADAIKALNKEYSMASTANKIARERMASEMGNNLFSLTDKIAAVGGASAGATEGYRKEGLPGAITHGLAGAGLGLISKGARSYGRPMIATGAMRGGEAIQKVPGLLGQTPVQSTVGMLGAQIPKTPQDVNQMIQTGQTSIADVRKAGGTDAVLKKGLLDANR